MSEDSTDVQDPIPEPAPINSSKFDSSERAQCCLEMNSGSKSIHCDRKEYTVLGIPKIVIFIVLVFVIIIIIFYQKFKIDDDRIIDNREFIKKGKEAHYIFEDRLKEFERLRDTSPTEEQRKIYEKQIANLKSAFGDEMIKLFKEKD